MSDEINRLRGRLEEMDELFHLAQSLGDTSNVEEVLASIVETCVRICRADHAAILLFSPFSGGALRTLIRSEGSFGGGIDHGLNLLIAGWIEHHGKPLLTADLVGDLNLKSGNERWREMGPAVAVTLESAGKTIGLLNLVNHKGGREFGKDALRLAEMIASLAARFIVRAKLHDTLFQDNIRLKTALHQKAGAREILGNSSGIQELRKKISAVALSSASVLLIGETGTGKELVARGIHIESARCEKPFIAINCSAIPASLFESELFGHERGAFSGASATHKGKFELAHEGTLFLDEIAEMPLDLQPKLLRVLEERSFCRVGASTELEVDVRVIAACSRDLHAAVQQGAFREELYHRLSVVPLFIPPLRQRTDDIPLLASAFLQEFSRGASTFDPQALEALQKLPWRGNVRELRNAIERICIFLPPGPISAADLVQQGIVADSHSASHLDTALQSFLATVEPGKDVLEMLEWHVVQLAYRQAKGNVSQAAKTLGIDRNAFQRRIDKLHLE
ncbi:MAG: sigma 54-interacting transcriptional regulator [Bacteroidota bacterium]